MATVFAPVHKLTAAEEARIVAYATSPEYRDLSPRQIVPLLADKGVYVASESSFYRVLHENGLMSHREGPTCVEITSTTAATIKDVDKAPADPMERLSNIPAQSSTINTRPSVTATLVPSSPNPGIQPNNRITASRT